MATPDDSSIELSVSGLSVKDDGVSFDKLSGEFKSTSAITSTSGTAVLDFGASKIFTATLTENTTFSFSNDKAGMIKYLVMDGSFTPTFPAGANIISGTYNGAVTNFIEIIQTAVGQYWIKIDQA